MKDFKLREAGAFLQKHQQPAKMLAVTVLVVTMSAWTSCSARAITKEARVAIDEAVAVRETASRISTQFVGATSGETDEWSRTTAEAAEFGTPEALRIANAQLVSRIGEVAGMSKVKTSFSPPDPVGVAEPRNMGDLIFQPATYGLTLESNGSVSAVARVILRLPPTTEITSLSLAGNTDQVQATFHLVVYQPTGGPQN